MHRMASIALGSPPVMKCGISFIFFYHNGRLIVIFNCAAKYSLASSLHRVKPYHSRLHYQQLNHFNATCCVVETVASSLVISPTAEELELLREIVFPMLSKANEPIPKIPHGLRTRLGVEIVSLFV